MLRSIVQRVRRAVRPSLGWLDRQASLHGCSVQALMDMDERNRWFPKEFRTQFGGFNPPGETREYIRSFDVDRVRSDMMALLLREIVVAKIPGAFAELGVHQGASARLIHHYCPERRFYLLDTFEGFAAEDLKAETTSVGFNKKAAFSDTSMDLVRKNVAPIGDTIRFVPGWFPQSSTDEMRADQYAFVHLDADLEAPITAGLEFFWPRLSENGFVIVHDYNAWPGAREAVDAFRAKTRVIATPMPDKSGSIVLRKP